MRRISVVLPVYNEKESIVPCLRGLASALASEDHEILVCFDTDEDSTLPAIAAMPDRPASVRLVKNTLGRGALNAIRTGFAAAQGDVVVTTMADLSDPPERIPSMAEKIRAGADVVSGSRYMRGGSQRGGPWLKRTLSRIAGVSLRWITGIGTHDSTSNFRAYSKRFLDSVAIESQAGFEIALELTVKAHLAGRKVDEVPSSWVERESGKSHFRLWKWLPSYLRWYLKAAAEPAFVLAVWAGMLVASVLFVARYGSPIPLMDDLELAANYAIPGELSVHGLWTPHNEHRIPMPRLVFLAMMGATKDVRSGMILQVGVLALLALASILVVRRIRGRTRFHDAFFPLLFQHTGNPQNLLMGFQLAMTLPIAIAFAVPLILATCTPRPSARKILLLGLCTLALPLNGGAGVANAPAFGAWMLATGSGSLWTRDRASRRIGSALAIVGVLSLAAVAAYFVGFSFPRSNKLSHSPGIFRTLEVAMQAASLGFGDAARSLGPWCAVATVAILLSTSVLLLQAWRKDPGERFRASGLAASLAGTVLLALSIGWGRGGIEGTPGLASRYVLLGAPILGTSFLAWLLYGGRARNLAHLVLLAATTAVLPANVAAGRRFGEALREVTSRIDERARHGASILAIVDEFQRDVYPTRMGAIARFEKLHQAGIAPFRGRRYEDNEAPPNLALFALGTLPDRIVGEAVGRRIDGVPSVLARPDCEIDYGNVASGSRIRGRFGIPPGAFRRESTRGVRFTVEWKTGEDPPRVLFERRFARDDPGPTSFSLVAPDDGPGSIALKATKEPEDPGNVWVYFSEIRLQ